MLTFKYFISTKERILRFLFLLVGVCIGLVSWDLIDYSFYNFEFLNEHLMTQSLTGFGFVLEMLFLVVIESILVRLSTGSVVLFVGGLCLVN